jgi:hypothetical protein
VLDVVASADASGTCGAVCRRHAILCCPASADRGDWTGTAGAADAWGIGSRTEASTASALLSEWVPRAVSETRPFTAGRGSGRAPAEGQRCRARGRQPGHEELFAVRLGSLWVALVTGWSGRGRDRRDGTGVTEGFEPTSGAPRPSWRTAGALRPSAETVGEDVPEPLAVSAGRRARASGSSAPGSRRFTATRRARLAVAAPLAERRRAGVGSSDQAWWPWRSTHGSSSRRWASTWRSLSQSRRRPMAECYGTPGAGSRADPGGVAAAPLAGRASDTTATLAVAPGSAPPRRSQTWNAPHDGAFPLSPNGLPLRHRRRGM